MIIYRKEYLRAARAERAVRAVRAVRTVRAVRAVRAVRVPEKNIGMHRTYRKRRFIGNRQQGAGKK